MNYKRIHNLIISSAKKRQKRWACNAKTGYELHHIKPRCISGDKRHQGERVWLTPREHYIIHQLLVKIDKRNPNQVFSLHRLAHHPDVVENGIVYHEWIKRRVSKQIGINNKKPKAKKKIAGIIGHSHA